MIISDLLITAFVTLLIGFIILMRYFSITASFLIIFIKVIIPFIYFLVAERPWTPYDGETFQRVALELLNQGHTPWSLLFKWDYLVDHVNSIHATPYWWNVLGQYLFGPYYFSPVFLNIILTLFIGIYLMFILSYAGFSEKYCKYYLAFFVIHWDVLVWSSFINIKGVLVTLLVVMYFYSLIRIVSDHRDGKSKYHVIWLMCILYIIYWSRFYIIAILIASTVLWLFIESEVSFNKMSLLGGTISFVGITSFGFQMARGTGYFNTVDFVNIITSVPRVILSPRPWAIQSEFSFLIVPAIFHWIFLIPAIIGFFRITPINKNIRLLSIYVVMFIGFYSLFSGLSSVRMRFQIIFVIILFQYHFIWELGQMVDIRYTR